MNKPFSMPSTRFGGAIKLMLLFAVEIGLVVAFHALGSIQEFSVNFSDLSGWLEATSPEVALVASIRILALVFSYWMLGTSLLYMIARSFRIPGLLRAMEFATVPGVRKIIDAGLAATIIGGTVFGGAAAVFARSAEAPTAAPAAASRVLYNPSAGQSGGLSTTQYDPMSSVQVDRKVVLPSDGQVAQAVEEETSTTAPESGPYKDPDGHYIPVPIPEKTSPTTQAPKVVVPSEDETTTTTQPKVTMPPTSAPVTTDPAPTPSVRVDGKQVLRPDADAPTQESTPTPSQTQEGTHTVVSGDNFWKIAQAQVANALGRDPSNAEVANYWVKLIEANRDTIRSGDPDLIFPGEVFVLPPV